jgi:hypothetical protein
MNFNIHGIFKFRINGTDKRYLKYFGEEYSFFRTDEEINSEMDIFIGDFNPSNENCYIIDRKYYVKEGYLFCRDRYKTVRWKLCIRLEDGLKVYFKGSTFGESMLKDYVIEPLMGYKISQKGLSLLHASGIAINSHGFVFSACQGVGKTSTAVNLMRDDAKFLGDDTVILSDDARVFSFPSPIHVFNYNMKSSPLLRSKMRLTEKLEVKIKYLLYLLSLKYVSFPLRLRAENLFELGKEYPLRALFHLTKTTKNTINVKEDVDKRRLAKRLVMNTMYESRHFSDYLSAYSYVYPDSGVASYPKILEDNIFNSLKKIRCYEIETPFQYNHSVYNEIYKILISYEDPTDIESFRSEQFCRN